MKKVIAAALVAMASLGSAEGMQRSPSDIDAEFEQMMALAEQEVDLEMREATPNGVRQRAADVIDAFSAGRFGGNVDQRVLAFARLTQNILDLSDGGCLLNQDILGHLSSTLKSIKQIEIGDVANELISFSVDILRAQFTLMRFGAFIGALEEFVSALEG